MFQFQPRTIAQKVTVRRYFLMYDMNAGHLANVQLSTGRTIQSRPFPAKAEAQAWIERDRAARLQAED